MQIMKACMYPMKYLIKFLLHLPFSLIYTVPLSPASFTSEFKRQHSLDLYIVYLTSFNSLNTWKRKI